MDKNNFHELFTKIGRKPKMSSEGLVGKTMKPVVKEIRKASPRKSRLKQGSPPQDMNSYDDLNHNADLQILIPTGQMVESPPKINL
jgi:hypothetical protein